MEVRIKFNPYDIKSNQYGRKYPNSKVLKKLLLEGIEDIYWF